MSERTRREALGTARYPYRSVQEVEDVIAHQLSLTRELSVLRRAAATTKLGTILDEQCSHAEAVLAWLRRLRDEMRRGPPQ